ncbi:putative nuclease HARBI1 [Clinocottus analis]|uniref:putative nuclease HARBI1 n=1 Tax=Clinocottus analis TaxID=304258 RepID=UPI0035C2673B
MPRVSVHRVVHTMSAQISALLWVGSLAGTIDGCHVRVKPQAEDAVCYFNRKLFHSIQLQAICDDKCKFIDVCVGYPGSVHDATVLKNGPIFYEQSYPPPGYCILGDGGYPCLSQLICLMTPFRQPVRNHLQARYNCCLSKARCVVERSFGILKTRWRSIFLKALEVDVRFVPEVIVCCTVLHNICLTNSDLLEPDADVGRAAEDQPAPEPPGNVSGAEKRQRIAAQASLCRCDSRSTASLASPALASSALLCFSSISFHTSDNILSFSLMSSANPTVSTFRLFGVDSHDLGGREENDGILHAGMSELSKGAGSSYPGVLIGS